MKRFIIMLLCLFLIGVGAFNTNKACAISFSDLINNAPGMNLDTNCNQDFSWNHNLINVPNGYAITSAQLTILAYDIDSDATDTDPKVIFSGRKEVDNIYAYDNGVKTFLGPLIGGSSVWTNTTFALGYNFFDDIKNGLVVFIDSDALGTSPYWVVQVGSSELMGTIDPTNPVPIPGAVWLFGSGLLGLAGWRRVKKI